LGGFSRPFLASAPAFLPGQQGDRAERPTKWEMIQEFFGLEMVYAPVMETREACHEKICGSGGTDTPRRGLLILDLSEGD
jgi:hypothetical protein